MNRLLALSLTVVTFCGCRGDGTSPMDPFAAHNRVPPPPTGSIRPGDPYYGQPPAGGPATLQPIPATGQPITMPAPGSPGTGPVYTPPPGTNGSPTPSPNYAPPAGSGLPPGYAPPGGSFNYQGSSTGPTRAIRSEPPAGGALPVSTSSSPIVRTISPRAKEAGGSSDGAPATTAAPAANSDNHVVPATGQVIDIADLPEAGASASTGGVDAASGVRQASATEARP
jgi:hypothetical protein